MALPCTLSAVSLRGEEGNLTQTDGRGQGSSQRAGSQGAPLTTTGTCGVPRGPCGEAAGPGSRNPDLHHHPRLLPASPWPRDGGWAGCVPGAQSHSDQGEGAQQDRRGVTNSNTSRGDFGSSRFGGAVYASVLAQRWRWLQGPPSDTVRAEMTGWGQPVPGFGGGLTLRPRRKFLSPEDEASGFTRDRFPLWYRQAAEQPAGSFLFTLRAAGAPGNPQPRPPPRGDPGARPPPALTGRAGRPRLRALPPFVLTWTGRRLGRAGGELTTRWPAVTGGGSQSTEGGREGVQPEASGGGCSPRFQAGGDRTGCSPRCF